MGSNTAANCQTIYKMEVNKNQSQKEFQPKTAKTAVKLYNRVYYYIRERNKYIYACVPLYAYTCIGKCVWQGSLAVSIKNTHL